MQSPASVRLVFNDCAISLDFLRTEHLSSVKFMYCKLPSKSSMLSSGLFNWFDANNSGPFYGSTLYLKNEAIQNTAVYIMMIKPAARHAKVSFAMVVNGRTT